MKLSKALKEKNKLIKRISKNQKLVVDRNSVIKGNTRVIEPRKVLEEVKADTEKLVRLKAAIAKANEPVNQIILSIVEKKGMIGFLKKINTNDGQVQERYGRDITSYEADIKENEIFAEVEKLEAEIESLQEQVESFNHTTEVDVVL